MGISVSPELSINDCQHRVEGRSDCLHLYNYYDKRYPFLLQREQRSITIRLLLGTYLKGVLPK